MRKRSTATQDSALSLDGTWALSLVPREEEGEVLKGTSEITAEWQFSKAYEHYSEIIKDKTFEFTIPGSIQRTLVQHGVLPDPYYGTEGEFHHQWIAEASWKLERRFTVPTISTTDECVLVCERLDTLVTLQVNGHSIGSADNLFRSHEFRFPASYLSSDNTLTLLFHSITRYCDLCAKTSTYPIPCMEYMNGVKNRCWVRKPGCHFGWDWGPALVPVGVYSPPLLHLPSTERILWKSFALHIRFVSPNDVRVLLSVWVEGNGRRVDATAKIKETGGTEWITSTQIGANSVSGTAKFVAELRIPHPKLWMPAGHGDQPVYTLQLVGEEGQIVFEKTSIGLREVRLVMKEDGEGSKARGFHFEVNQRPIFAKGANWIPTDVFLERGQSVERYRNLLCSAVECNMNMIRVWGGGWYEAEEFYEECDRLGILVFHDFMFACSLYPATRKFLKNVRSEIEQVVRRLGAFHPCIVCWCANNENEEALEAFPESSLKEGNRDRYVVDYAQLYLGTIYKVFQREMDGPAEPSVCASAEWSEFELRHHKPGWNAAFWPSSPSNGVGEWGNPADKERGDQHYWGVWHSNQPFSEYLKIRPRFCSEFGFQSFPSEHTLQPVWEDKEEDANVNSRAMTYRQRSPARGNTAIVEHVSRQFRLPTKFGDWIYLSQVLQAMSIKAGVEHWRRLKPWCMGTLYWQLNDIWPGTSWSSIEYDGTWKVLQSAAKRFYAPLLISAVEEGGRLEVWATSDLEEEIESEVEMEVWRWKEKKEEWKKSIKVRIGRRESRKIEELGMEVIGEGKEERREKVVVMRLRSTDGRYVNENEYYLEALKEVNLRKPTIKVSLVEREERVFVRLKSDVVTPFVVLSLEDERDRSEMKGQESWSEGHFAENGVLLLPEKEIEVEWKGRNEALMTKSQSRLCVKSLYSSYH